MGSIHIFFFSWLTMLLDCIAWLPRPQKNSDIMNCRRLLSHGINVHALYNLSQSAEWLDAKLHEPQVANDTRNALCLVKRVCTWRSSCCLPAEIFPDIDIHDFLTAHMIIAFPTIFFSGMRNASTERVKALQRQCFSCAYNMLALFYDVNTHPPPPFLPLMMNA